MAKTARKRQKQPESNGAAVNWKRSYEQACRDFDLYKTGMDVQISELKKQQRAQFQDLTKIRKLADRTLGIDRTRSEPEDERSPGAIGAVLALTAKYEHLRAALQQVVQALGPEVDVAGVTDDPASAYKGLAAEVGLALQAVAKVGITYQR